MTLQTRVRHIQADTAVVSFAGNLTMGTGLKVADTQIQNLIEKDVRWIVFDLTEVAYIDSAGLGTLVHTRGLVQQKNGMLRLCRVADRVAALLKLTGMDAVLPVDSDEASSLAAIRSAVT
jgi:anti-sigma B factor antagonist